MGNQQSQMTGEEDPGSPSKRLASLSPEIDEAQNPIFSSQVLLPPNGRLNPHQTSNLALEKNLDRPTSPLSASQARSQINEHDDNDGLPLHIPNFGSPEKISVMAPEPKEKTKRRRSKKHSGSKSDPDDSPRAGILSSLDLGMPTDDTADQVNGLSPGSSDNNNDESGIAAEESESSQRRAKRERKEQKKAQKAEKERLRLEQVKAEPEDETQMNGSMHVPGSDELPEHTSTLKRKVKDSSSKKQRKKRKQRSEGEFETANNSAAPPDQEDSIQPDGAVAGGHGPVASTSALQDEPSFEHFAQNVYSSRYGSHHDTPNDYDDSRLDVDGEDAEQSPSAARLSRRSRSRANSVASQQSTGEAVPIQPEPATQDEDDAEPSQYMDIDEQSSNRTEATDAGLTTKDRSQAQPQTNHSSADEDMADADQEDDLPIINHDAQGGETPMNGAELGSDDLGATAPTDVMFSDADTDVDIGAHVAKKAAAPETQASESNMVDPRIIKEPPVKSAKSSRKTGLLQQYGSKSTGRKRVAKQPFTNGSPEENVESRASLPGGLSPAAGAAERRNAKAGDDSEQEAAESGSVEANSPAEGKAKAKAKGKGKASSAAPGNATMAPNRRGSFVSKPRTVPDPPKEKETKGPFSQYEMGKLKTVLEHWKEDHSMDQHDLNEMMHKNPQLVKSFDFWDAVHAVVPTRRRQKVIDQCRRIWHNFVALGTWTPEQHRELVLLHETHGNNYRIIGQMINRHPEDVRERIRNYVIPGDKRKTEAWTKAEEDKLLAIIEASVKEIRSQKAKGEIERDVADDQFVDWLEVSEQMGRTRSRLQCIYKWKKLQLKMAGGVIDGQAGRSMDDIIAEARREAATMPALHLYYVVKGVKDAGTISESRIPWAKLGDRSQRTGKYPRATLIVVWVRLRRTIPNDTIFTVKDIADKLCAKHRHEQELRWPADDEVDLKEEYDIVEKKILKILQATGRPKTPYYDGKSESKAVDEDSDGDNEAGNVANAASEANTKVTPSRSSIDLSFNRPKPAIPSDREIEESDYGSPKQPALGKKTAKKAAKKARKEVTQSSQVQNGDDDEPSSTFTKATKSSKAKKAHTPSTQARKRSKESSTTSPDPSEASEASESVETTEPTEPTESTEITTTKKARATQTPSSQARKSNQEPSKATTDTTEPVTTTKAKKASTNSSKSRKTWGGSSSARRRTDRDKRAQTGRGEHELSSDTDAENVEDIPARVSPNKKR